MATTSRIVLENGLATVGMRDLMQAAGLTAGGFYRHFASRDELIAAAIRAAFDRLLAMLEKEKAKKPRSEQLQRVITIYLGQSRHSVDGTAPYLCPLAQLGGELKHAAAMIQAEGFDGYRRLVRLVGSCLMPESSRSAELRAEFIVNTMVGAVTLASLAPDEKTGVGILNEAKRLLGDEKL